MQDQIIAAFREEFERFHDLCAAQIDACPDDLWLKKCGGYPLWQQLLHTFACIELLYVSPALKAQLTPEQEVATGMGRELGCGYNREILLLKRESNLPMSKEDMRTYAGEMKALGLAYLDGLDAKSLTLPHKRMSALLGRPRTVQHALIGMVRHACYHLGCADAVLREHGLPGVY